MVLKGKKPEKKGAGRPAGRGAFNADEEEPSFDADFSTKINLASDDDSDSSSERNAVSDSESSSESETSVPLKKNDAVKQAPKPAPKTAANSAASSQGGPSREMSRREREAVEKEQARQHYLKMKEKEDAARLAVIRKQREEAAIKHAEAQRAKELAKRRI